MPNETKSTRYEFLTYFVTALPLDQSVYRLVEHVDNTSTQIFYQ